MVFAVDYSGEFRQVKDVIVTVPSFLVDVCVLFCKCRVVTRVGLKVKCSAYSLCYIKFCLYPSKLIDKIDKRQNKKK